MSVCLNPLAQTNPRHFLKQGPRRYFWKGTNPEDRKDHGCEFGRCFTFLGNWLGATVSQRLLSLHPSQPRGRVEEVPPLRADAAAPLGVDFLSFFIKAPSPEFKAQPGLRTAGGGHL